MATNVSLNGNVYSIPSVGEDNWGQSLTDYFIAIPPAVLQKSGGNFTITADVNFGATYGLLAKYFASRSGAATDGLIRLANLDTIKWRNFANSADIGLSVDSSDILQFNGSPLLTGGITSLTDDVTASGPGAAVATISANAVTNAKLAQVASGVFKARATASTGDVEDLSPTQATALLDNFVGDSGAGGLKGLAPAPAAGDAAALKFLKADGTWSAVPGGTLFNVIDGPASSIIECDVLTNLAGGTFSIAEGTNTSASGNNSHAGGNLSVSSGVSSFAHGTGTVAQGFNQIAGGQYNIAQGSAASYVASDYSLILGKGANSGARANSFAVKKDGTIDLYGSTSGILSVLPAAVTTSHSLTMPAAQGAASSVLTNDGSGGLSWVPAASAIEVAVFNETQSSGTPGGAFTFGAWRTRVLNTTQQTQSWASLSANQVTLAAGTYLIQALAPCFAVDQNLARLYNITDATSEIQGQSTFASAGNLDFAFSPVVGVITIASSKVFELQHQCVSTRATNGFGVAVGFALINEIYSTIAITKLA